MMKENIWLTCASINVGIALLHIYIIFKGAPAYRYFGAGEWMASKSEMGSMIPALVTWAVTIVFFVFAAFNLAGAKVLSLPVLSLPLTLYALIAISAIYILRGAVVFAIPFMTAEVSVFDKVSSFIALAIGLLHATGSYIIFMEK
jgi:hypothetical protein